MFRTVSTTASHVVALCTTTWIFIGLVVFVPGTVAQWLSYEAVSERLSDRCGYGEFDCALGDECIPLSKFRDGHTDCLDGSDEYCFPGQIKCGLHCVELAHFGECILNPHCDNSTTLPSYCSLIKTKLCQFDDALPCKGYGECVLRKWLNDGHKDCFDGSDEDPGYTKLLTSCLYPENSPHSDGFIEVPAPETNQLPLTRNPFYPAASPAPTPFNPYQIPLGPGPNLPNILGIPTLVPPWQTPKLINDIFGSKKPPTLPPFEIFPTLPPIIYPITIPSGELLPIKSEPPSVSVSTQSIGNANTLQSSATPILPSIYPGLSGPIFGKIGVEKGKGGVFQPEEVTPITPINEPHRPASPFIDNSSGKPAVQETGGGTDDSTWVQVDNNANGEGPFSEIATRDPEKVTWSPYRVVNTHWSGGGEVHPAPIPPTVRPIDHNAEQGKTAGSSGGGYEGNNGDWIVVEQQTPMPVLTPITPVTPIIPLLTKPSASGEDSFFEITTESSQKPETSTVHPSTSLGTSSNEVFLPHVIPIATPSSFPLTIKTTQVTSTYSTTTSDFLITTSTQHPEVEPTEETSVESSHMTELSVSDPNLFPYGIDERLTTTAPDPLLNCTEKFKQMASELAPTPMCDCPSGQMRNLQGKCVKAEISTFRARLMRLCGTNVKNVNNEAQILAWKLASTFNYPICVRKAGDLVILNTVCDGCEFTDLIDTYAMNNDLAEIDIKLSELKDSGCYEFSINDCDEKAECVPQGLRYKCMCLPGTTDTVDGSGRHCDGTVIANQCTKFLGVCVLFWILLLLFLLTMCLVVSYFAYKYCKRHDINIFRKTKVKKKGGETTSTSVQKGNVELGVPVNDVNQTQHENRGSTSVAFPTPTSAITAPRSTPVNKFLPADEYCIIENDENEDEDDVKAEVASVAPSHESFVVIDKTPAAVSRKSTPDAPPVRKATSDSRSSTPTIWESYKILGNQYTRFNSAKRRRSSSHSLEMLMHKKREDEVKKQRTTMLNVPNVGIVDSHAAALPPLPTVSFTTTNTITPPDGKKPLERRGSRTSNTSNKSKVSDQAAKLAEMLGVTGSIPEQQVQAIAEATATEIIKAIEPELETSRSSEGFVPSTPDIIKAAEIAVTDALKNVIGPHYEHNPSSATSAGAVEVQAGNDRLQTSTIATPGTPRDGEPDVAVEAEPSSQPISEPSIAKEPRPPSGTSQKSRTILPTPTIEDNKEIAANLDKVAVALSQLPPLPPLSSKDDKTAPSTHPSSAKSVGKTKQPKTSRSLSGEHERGIAADMSKNGRMATSAKAKTPVTERQKSKTPRTEPLSRLTTTTRKTSHQDEALTKRRKISGAPAEKKAAPDKPLPGTKHRTGSVPRLPPIPRQTSTSSVKAKKTSTSNPPTSRSPMPIKTLPKIGSTPTTPRRVTKKQPPTKLPPLDTNATSVSASAPNTTREGTKITPPSKTTSERSTSRLPVLVDPEKAAKSSVFCRCDEPDFMLADLDLDLPGPYMIPAKSIEDLREAGFTSRLPRLKPTSSSQSAPNTERLHTRNELYRRQISTKSEDGSKLSMNLPPIDVDLDNLDNTTTVKPEIDLDTNNLDTQSSKPAKSTIARKIASRKAAGFDYAVPKLETPKPVYEYTRPSAHHGGGDHVHDGCIRNQPPWDASPLRDGDLDTIPLDWNISRSNSSMSFSDRRSQSFGDIHKLTAVGFLSARPDFARQLTQSGSLTNLFHFKAKIRGVDADWADDLKQSLKKNNSWLDYD
uniref:EGF-like domain-containing protein n=2 Tax=Panagrellus redivivus TaxID=6233 RepID=A0A7E4VXL7_PANRE